MNNFQRVSNGTSRISVDETNGQLVSVLKDKIELMRGEDPNTPWGWNQSEIACFPFWGPSPQGYATIDGVTFPLDDHGLRLNYQYLGTQVPSNTIVTRLIYNGEKIPNQKEREPHKMFFLPFESTKIFTLKNNGISVNLSFKNTSNQDIPHNPFWHPTFRHEGNLEKAKLILERTNGSKIIFTLQELLEFTAKAKNPIRGNIARAIYSNKEFPDRDFSISSEILKTYCLWMPSPETLAIELGLFKPSVSRTYFHDSERYAIIKSDKRVTYPISIKF